MDKTADTTVAGIAWVDKPATNVMVLVVLALLVSMGLNVTKVWPQIKLLCFVFQEVFMAKMIWNSHNWLCFLWESYHFWNFSNISLSRTCSRYIRVVRWLVDWLFGVLHRICSIYTMTITEVYWSKSILRYVEFLDSIHNFSISFNHSPLCITSAVLCLTRCYIPV